MSVAEMPSPPIRVSPASNGMMMTGEEFDAIDDWIDGYRYELIHGVLVVSPPAGIGERSPNSYLAYLIYSFNESHENGAVVDDTVAEQEIKIGGNRRRMDRAIWVGLGHKIRPLEDVPTIAIEFVSKSSRDRRRDYVEKRREYAEAGVKEYWVIDRFARDMTVFRGMDETLVVKEGECYSTPLMPGFELPLAKLFARAELHTDTDE